MKDDKSRLTQMYVGHGKKAIKKGFKEVIFLKAL
jgi:hypothetical protein